MHNARRHPAKDTDYMASLLLAPLKHYIGSLLRSYLGTYVRGVEVRCKFVGVSPRYCRAIGALFPVLSSTPLDFSALKYA